jgi:hypothetical protein
MQIARFFDEGGPLMFLGVLVFLAVMTVIILQFAFARRKNLVPFIVGGIALTFLVGGLATILGISKSFAALGMVAPDQQAAIMAAGIAESINNLSLAFVFAFVETIVGAIAAFKRVNAKADNA